MNEHELKQMTVVRGVVGNNDRHAVKTTRTAPIALDAVPTDCRAQVEAALRARHAGDVRPTVWNTRIAPREGWIVEREGRRLIIAHYRSEIVPTAQLDASTFASVALDWVHDREVQLAEIGRAFLDASGRAGELQALLADANIRAQRLAEHARDVDDQLDAARKEIRDLKKRLGR